MAKVVGLTIPTEQFALSDMFASVPDATVETVPVAAHPPRGLMSVLSVAATDSTRVEDAIRTDESTENVVTLSEGGNQYLYRVSWRPRVRTVLAVFLQSAGSLLCGWGAADQWTLRFLFPEQESISAICENWREHGIDPSIQRVVDVAGQVGFPGMELSECQHDTMLRAYEMGYYGVPREAKLECVAEDLQVSHQALSERLRRGHRNLIEKTLCQSTTPRTIPR